MSFVFGKFENGREEAVQCIDLLKSFEPSNRVPPKLDENDAMLLELFSWVSEKWGVDKPLPYLNGFFSGTVRNGGIDFRDIYFLGIDEIRTHQQEVAPICNLPSNSRFIQFAYTDGGDAWVADLGRNCLRLIDVASGTEDIVETRSESVAVLPNFRQFYSFLRCVEEDFEKDQRVSSNS